MKKIKTEQSVRHVGKDAVIVVVSGYIRCQKVAILLRGVAFDWACCTGKEQQDILKNSDSYGHEKLQGEERLVQASWCPMFDMRIPDTTISNQMYGYRRILTASACFRWHLPLRAYQADGASSCGCQM